MLFLVVNSCIVRAALVRADRVHLDKAGLRIGQNLTVSLQTEAKLTIFEVLRCIEDSVKVDIDSAFFVDSLRNLCFSLLIVNTETHRVEQSGGPDLKVFFCDTHV